MLNDAVGFEKIFIAVGLSSRYFYLKPQIRAISASSSGHSGFSSIDILPDSIALRIISTEGTA